MLYFSVEEAYQDGYTVGYNQGYDEGRRFGQEHGQEDGEDYAWETAIRLFKLPSYCLNKYFSDLKDKEHDCIFTYKIFENYSVYQLEQKLNEIEKKERIKR